MTGRGVGGGCVCIRRCSEAQKGGCGWVNSVSVFIDASLRFSPTLLFVGQASDNVIGLFELVLFGGDALGHRS